MMDYINNKIKHVFKKNLVKNLFIFSLVLLSFMLGYMTSDYKTQTVLASSSGGSCIDQSLYNFLQNKSNKLESELEKQIKEKEKMQLALDNLQKDYKNLKEESKSVFLENEKLKKQIADLKQQKQDLQNIALRNESEAKKYKKLYEAATKKVLYLNNTFANLNLKEFGIYKFKATAYSPYDNRDGLQAQGSPFSTSRGAVPTFGTIAINPKYVKYGSPMFIFGYGAGIAEDTGGAIRKSPNRLDLFFQTYDEAMKFGVKEVYVLMRKKDTSLKPVIDLAEVLK